MSASRARLPFTFDVPCLIAQLEGAGLTHDQIRARCEVKSRSAVSAWRAGEKLPSLMPGLRLLILHAEHFPACSPLRTIIAVSLTGEGQVAGQPTIRGIRYETAREEHHDAEDPQDSR